jgi:hypothetical protein
MIHKQGMVGILILKRSKSITMTPHQFGVNASPRTFALYGREIGVGKE